MESMELAAGVYAITGANGSGKSTLFRVLMSCNTNDKPIDLPASIVMGHNPECVDSLEHMANGDVCEGSPELEVENANMPLSIGMPSSNVVEISQTFYWPLYTKPIDWIYQAHLSEMDEAVREKYVTRVVDELQGLLFTRDVVKKQKNGSSNGSSKEPMQNSEASRKLYEDLQEEKEDWFNDLSGGQKSKVELVRKVSVLEQVIFVRSAIKFSIL